MTLQLRTQALLDLVEADRRARCAELTAQAERQAAATLAHARAEARRRMREAFTEERTRAAARVAAARAELQTRHRLHEQQQAAGWLAVGWQRLPAALHQRWTDAAPQEAARVLAPGRWRIVHAPGWPPSEREALAARLQAAAGTTAAFAEDA